ncbi:histidine phosphatase family protein [Symbiobacterium terraclitae]|uniref:histidine phosphatase family protein n=1 Tax=Symbiobacterium terraclitae TaxID=557451 RepID=UPI0035B4FB27
MELLVIRHGQSEADVTNRHEGRADFPLTELGREQAARLADWVARTCTPDLIWSSPLQRAAETARIIAARTGAPLVFKDGLVEMDNGVLAGLPRDEARQKYPPPPGGRRYHERIPGGESELEFRARVESVFAELVYSVEPERRVAVVAHGGTITMLFRAFLGLPLTSDVWLGTADTGVHLWRILPERRVVLLANSTAHLQG